MRNARIDGVGVDERIARLQRALRDASPKRRSSRSTATSRPSTCTTSQGTEAKALPADPRELSFVKEAMAAIDNKGGYPEALARVAFLMAHKDEPAPAFPPAARARPPGRIPRLPARAAEGRGATYRWRARDHRPLRAGQGGARRCRPPRDPNDRERLLTLLDSRAGRQARAKDPALRPSRRAMLARIRGVLASPPRGGAKRRGNGSGKAARRAAANASRGANASRETRRRPDIDEGAPREHRPATRCVAGLPATRPCSATARRFACAQSAPTTRSGCASHSRGCRTPHAYISGSFTP